MDDVLRDREARVAAAGQQHDVALAELRAHYEGRLAAISSEGDTRMAGARALVGKRKPNNMLLLPLTAAAGEPYRVLYCTSVWYAARTTLTMHMPCGCPVRAFRSGSLWAVTGVRRSGSRDAVEEIEVVGS